MKRRGVQAAIALVALLSLAPANGGTPPAQRLPSALLIYPLVVTGPQGDGQTWDTRIEVVNLTSRAVTAQCFFLRSGSCGETGFQLILTGHQPVSWLASQGSRGLATLAAVPPFSGTGEMKCVVTPTQPDPDLDAHNALQGRAIAFGSDGQTIGYGAVGFRRLVPGELENTLELDNQTYEQCPDEMHFAFLASGDGPTTQSEIVLSPCFEDLENQVPGTATVQFKIVNEFEQALSAVTTVTCHDRRTLININPAFSRNTLGSDIGHVTVRGVDVPVVGLLIDRFESASPSTSGNEPALRGGRSATVFLP